VLRLVLRNGKKQVSGWVMLAPYLEAVRERGSVAESIIRIVSGFENNSDIEVILEFFAESPQALVSLASSHARTAGSDTKAEIERTVRTGDLVPVSREAISERGHGSRNLSAFERLLQRLREYVSAHPFPDHDEEEEAQEEGEEDANNGVTTKKKTRSRNKKPKRKMPHEDFNRFVEAFIDQIESRADEVGRRADLLTLLDLGLFFSARAEDPLVLHVRFLNKWAELAFRLTKPTNPPDEVEQSLLLVLLVGVITGQDKPESVLAALQRRIASRTNPAWADAIVKIQNSRRAVALAAEATPEKWSDTLLQVVSSRTPWMDAKEVWDSVTARRELPQHNLLLHEPEANTLQAIAAGEQDIDRIQVIDGKATLLSCPRCHRTLPSGEVWRLRNRHIASTVNCCNRVLLDLKP
jgi:hypothetical protein